MRDLAASKTCSGKVLRVNSCALSIAQFACFQSAQAENGAGSSDYGLPEQTKIALRQSAQGKSLVLEHNTAPLEGAGFAQAGRTSEKHSSSRTLKRVVPPHILALVDERLGGKRLTRSVRARLLLHQIGMALKYGGRAKSRLHANENDSQLEFPRRSTGGNLLGLAQRGFRPFRVSSWPASGAATPLRGLAGPHSTTKRARLGRRASVALLWPMRWPGALVGAWNRLCRAPALGPESPFGTSNAGAPYSISVRFRAHVVGASGVAGKTARRSVRLACAVNPGGRARSSRVRPPPIPQRIASHRPRPGDAPSRGLVGVFENGFSK